MNAIVPGKDLVKEAVRWARRITDNSPDAVLATKSAILYSQDNGIVDALDKATWAPESTRVYQGENIKVFHTLLHLFKS